MAIVAGLAGRALTRGALPCHLSPGPTPPVAERFEVTIRLLGSLLSGHQRTGDRRLLTLAEDLGTRLLPVFHSPTRMPYRFVNLRTGKTSGAQSNPAEIGTLLLEFGTQTLKYLYLLFAPEETLDLRKVVLNTEAHPLERKW